MSTTTDIFGHRRYWAHRLTPAPSLRMTREEMDLLGWDSCDVDIVSGDAYVDHPSFGMAIVGRLPKAQGFRLGIVAQLDWHAPVGIMSRGNLYSWRGTLTRLWPGSLKRRSREYATISTGRSGCAGELAYRRSEFNVSGLFTSGARGYLDITPRR